jgi:hypothetical protein
LASFAPARPIFAEREGYKPADFDNLVENLGKERAAAEISEKMRFDAMPDFAALSYRANEPTVSLVSSSIRRSRRSRRSSISI